MSGSDARARLNLTSRFLVRGNVRYWNSRKDSDKFLLSGRLSATYQLREWIKFSANARKSATKDAIYGGRVDLEFALGAEPVKRKRKRKRKYDRVLYRPVSRFRRVEFAEN